MPTALIQQKPPFGSLRTDPHWSVQGLVFYSFFRPAGVLRDESPFGNHGTITGATWVGDGLSFNGSSDYIDFPDTIDLSGEGTLIIRFKVNTWAISDRIMQEGQAGYVDWFLVGANTVRVQMYDTNFTVHDITLATGTWITIAAVWGVGRADAYADGVVIGTDPTFTGVSASAQNGFTVCSERAGGTQFLAADVSDIKLYNRALSDSEVMQISINPDLPMQQEPIWLGSVAAAPTGFKPYWALNNNRLVGAM